MPSARPEPRKLLWDASLFGKDTKAAWKPWAPIQAPAVAAAYFQHLVVWGARRELQRHDKPYDGKVSALVHELAERQLIYSEDPQQAEKKFAGSRNAQMDDYMAWVQVLGNRILPRFKSRAETLPSKYVSPAKPSPDSSVRWSTRRP